MNDDIKDCIIELLAMQICSLALEANKRIKEKKGETFFILEPETYMESCKDFAKEYLAGLADSKGVKLIRKAEQGDVELLETLKQMQN